MLIKIISSKYQTFWYSNLIGRMFDVEYNEMIDAYQFVMDNYTYWISKEDAEEIKICTCICSIIGE
jgi:hypothetical protein